MLPLPYPAPFSAMLYVLLGLDLLLLGSGLAFGRPRADGTGRLPKPLCLSLSTLLVLAALLQWLLARGVAPAATYARWILAGMALGLVGDLIMAQWIPVPDRLIFGMLAFGLGHVAYVVALARLSAGLGLWSPGIYLPVLALVAGLVVVLWYTLVRKPWGNPQLNGAALIYSLLMATLNAFAIGLALRQARFIPLAMGAGLFLASDLVLGNWNIRGHSWRRINDVVWVTYNLGQLLIVSSVAALAGIPLPRVGY